MRPSESLGDLLTHPDEQGVRNRPQASAIAETQPQRGHPQNPQVPQGSRAGRMLLEAIAREFHHDVSDLLDWYREDIPYLASVPAPQLRQIVRDYIDNRAFYRGGCRIS